MKKKYFEKNGKKFFLKKKMDIGGKMDLSLILT